MNINLASFTDVLGDEIANSQPLSLSSSSDGVSLVNSNKFSVPSVGTKYNRPPKGTGQCGQSRSTEEIDPKYRHVFSYPYFNQVQSNVIEDGLYSDKSIVVCAPTGSGKTVIFEMAIVQLLMELEDTQYEEDFKIIYMAPVKALCTERLTEWYPKFTKLGLMCIEVTGDTEVDFSQLKPYKIIITTPEKWDILTRRWRDHRALVEVIKLFLIDEVHILNDCVRGPVLEAVVSRMKTIESSAQSAHRIEKLQKEILGEAITHKHVPRIRFVAVSATVSNPEDVSKWLGSSNKPAVYYKYGDECRPVKLKRVVEGYPYPEGASMFKFDIILNYKLWPIIQKYHSGKPTLIFCNTRKSVVLTAETLSREITINFNAEQKSKLTALAATIKNKKLQALVLSGVGCHHAGLLYEERMNIELAFRNKDLPILITTTTLAMGVNLPAHLVIIKNTQQYVNGAYQEYSISTVLQMVGRAGRPQFDTEATAVIMTRLADKARYQSLLGGCEPLQSYLHKRLAENLNSEAALGTVGDVAQCVQWLRSTFLYVRALQDPRKYLGLPQNSPQQHITKKIEELCVRAMNGLSSAGLITMDEASCIESTEAGRLMSLYYLDLETMKNIMKIEGSETLERLLLIICESHELSDMHLRVDERRTLNGLNRSNTAATIRFPMKGKISTRQMKLNCIIQAVLGCLPIVDPSLNQEAMKVMRIAERVCKCLVAYITRKDLISMQPQFYNAVLNSIVLAKCVAANLWENSPYVCKQLKGIGTAFSTLLASAGKTNFTLLEESHPRDLERLMNKGPPAGNLLRKQISLLPKYQLAMLPRDEKTVVVKLVLVNQAYLMENMDNLTAGSSHKSYILVGDSENNLLHLACFKDKDLITVFDGTINYEIRRKHNLEHKIFAHCISSQFVGIDDQVEYNFNSLQPISGPSTKQHTTPTNKQSEKQTCITDTFKERKRKSTTEIDMSSEEKKIKKNNFLENFRPLKGTLKDASKMLKQYEYQKPKEIKPTVLDHNTKSLITPETECNNQNTLTTNNDLDIKSFPIADDTCELDNDYDCIDDDKIASILIEIEKEMLKDSLKSTKSVSSVNQNIQKSSGYKARTTQNHKFFKTSNSCSAYKNLPLPKKNRKFNSKSNYTFLDLLEKNVDLEDSENELPSLRTETGFSEAIKGQIQKYLNTTQNKCKAVDKSLEMMLNDTQDQKQEQNIVTPDSDRMEVVDLETLGHEVRENSVDLKSSNNAAERCSVNQNDNSAVINKDNTEHTKINNNRSKYDQKELIIEKLHSTSPKEFKCATSLKEDVAGLRDNELSINTLTNNGVPSDKVSLESRVSSDVGNPIIPMSTNINDIIALEPNICDFNKSTDKRSNVCRTITSNDESKLSDELNIHKPEIHGCEHQFETLNEIDVACGKIQATGTKLNNNMALIPYQHDKEMHMEGAEEINTMIKEFDIIPICNKGHDKIVSNGKYDRKINKNSSMNCKLTTNAPNQAIEYPSEVITSNNTKIVDKYMNNKYGQECNTAVSNEPRRFLNKCPQGPEKQHFNKYSYSATKIDVSNKKTTDCNVQVIKKVKLSYDITEIITPCVGKTSKDFRCANNLRDRQGNSNFSINKSESYNDLFTNHLAIESRNDIKDTKSNESQIEYYKPNKKICHGILSNSNTRTAIQNNEAANSAAHLSNTRNEQHYTSETNLDENQTQRVAVLQNPQIDTEIKKHGSLNNISKKSHTNENEMQRVDNITNNPVTQIESSEPIFKCNKSVQNVLQKYLNLAGEKKSFKASTSTENKTPVIKMKNKSGTEETYSKSKKPFRISDIHQLEVDLPNKLLLDDTTNTKTDTVLPEVLRDAINKNYSSQTSNYIENKNTLEQNDTVFVTQNVIHNMECATPDTSPEHNLDLEVLPTPSFYEDHNFELGMNMFDPKALLQCVLNEDCGEVIPPPPEFVDQNTYLPEYNNLHEREFMSETRESIVANEDFNESIFADQFPTTLTPSKEIETWTLEPEDNWGNNSSGYSDSPKAFTVMRRNAHKPERYDLLETPKSLNRNGLNNFKFTHKSKWKARK